jgi:hypothetical protein
MLKHRIATGPLLALALVAGVALAAENLKSGPQVGQEVPGPFHPLNVTGENAGEKVCLFCKNGSNPVAMIFAREVSDNLTNLIKKIDSATAEHKDAKMGSFVVFLSDSEDLPKQLKEVADKEKITSTVLSVDSPAGPAAYKVAKDADVTVVLYTNRSVKANHAFGKGELKEKDIDTVVADLGKILPKE